MAFVVFEEHEKGKSVDDLDTLELKIIGAPPDELIALLKKHAKATPC